MRIVDPFKKMLLAVQLTVMKYTILLIMTLKTRVDGEKGGIINGSSS